MLASETEMTEVRNGCIPKSFSHINHVNKPFISQQNPRVALGIYVIPINGDFSVWGHI